MKRPTGKKQRSPQSPAMAPGKIKVKTPSGGERVTSNPPPRTVGGPPRTGKKP